MQISLQFDDFFWAKNFKILIVKNIVKTCWDSRFMHEFQKTSGPKIVQNRTIRPRIWLCGDCNGLEWRQSLILFLSQWQSPKTTWSDVVRSWTSPSSLKRSNSSRTLTRTPFLRTPQYTQPCPRCVSPLVFSLHVDQPAFSTPVAISTSKRSKSLTKTMFWILIKKKFVKIQMINKVTWKGNCQQQRRQLWHFPGKFG